MDTSTLVLGLDVGGTSSRAQVCDLTGATRGVGQARGGNPNSHPPAYAAEQISLAAKTALADVDPAKVATVVLGMAGVSKMADPDVAALFDKAWPAIGVRCPVHVVGDAEVAFAAGTSAPTGTVLIAGTGSIAARIEQHQLLRTAGGHGWLLGDEGSAFWLGREAVRATLAALDRAETTTGELRSSVITALLPNQQPDAPAALRHALITAANRTAPIALAELAPLVTTAANTDDTEAREILDRAARLLTDTVERLRPAGDNSPVVLAGGLVRAGNPLGEALHAELTARTAMSPHRAGPGAAGAAWLAARRLLTDDDALSPAQLHAAYLA